MRKINDFGVCKSSVDNTFHNGRERPFVTEVSRNGYDARRLQQLTGQLVEMPVGIAEYLANHGKPFEVVADIKFPAHAHATM